MRITSGGKRTGKELRSKEDIQEMITAREMYENIDLTVDNDFEPESPQVGDLLKAEPKGYKLKTRCFN